MRNFTNTRFQSAMLTTAIAAASAACASSAPEAPKAPVDPNDPLANVNVGEPLTALQNACTYNSTTNVMSVTLSTSDNVPAIISRRASDGAILQNNATCVLSTSASTAVTVMQSSLKKIAITGTSAADVIILDFTNGSFATGTSSGTGSSGIVVEGGGGADKLAIKGTSGNDTFTFGKTATATVATAGSLLLFGNDAYPDFVADSTNSSTFTYQLSLGSGNDSYTFTGASGASVALAAGVTVYGGAGDDSFAFGSAAAGVAQVVSGGAGNDTIDFSNRTNALTISCLTLATGGGSGESGEGNTVMDDIEVIKGGSAADSFKSKSSANTHIWYGNAGNDSLTAQAALDANDVFWGGAGNDTVDYSARTVAGGVTADLASGTNDSGSTGENDTIQTDVENIVGSSLADTLIGNSANNTITGGSGADSMTGNSGDDTFIALAAADGTDTMACGAGIDTIDYSARTIVVTATLDPNVTAAGSDSDQMGTTNTTDCENLIGSTKNDSLTGNSLDNQIIGGVGDDTISGGAGDDIINSGTAGNSDNDNVDCGSGDGDIEFYTNGSATIANCEFVY